MAGLSGGGGGLGHYGRSVAWFIERDVSQKSFGRQRFIATRRAQILGKPLLHWRQKPVAFRRAHGQHEHTLARIRQWMRSRKSTTMTWLLVGIGGAVGALARHAVNSLVHRYGATFPWGIFIINVSGSLVIGLLAGLLAAGRIHMGAQARVFVIVGVLGGFTTFSSFTLDTLTLIRAGHIWQAAGNVAGQVGLSLLAVMLGFSVGAAKA